MFQIQSFVSFKVPPLELARCISGRTRGREHLVEVGLFQDEDSIGSGRFKWEIVWGSVELD